MKKYYLTFILLYLIIPKSELLAKECRRYLVLYPVNYNFNNSVRILEQWKEDNSNQLNGCDKFISTKEDNATLLEVNIDFFNYKSFQIINKSQADYILENTNATHLVKIAQTIVSGDLALMPIVFNLQTLKIDKDPPFHKVTVLEKGALSLLNYGSLNNILSNLMRLMLPNSLAIGPGLNYLRNHRLLANEIDVEIVDGNTQLWPSIQIDLNKIYPPFAYDKEPAFSFNLASSFKFSRSSEIYELKQTEAGSAIDQYELDLYRLNINFFTELAYSSFIGTFYSNLGFGWNLIYLSDNLDRDEFDDVISLNANIGYRYFFNKDVFLELDMGYSQYIPNLIDTPYIYVNNEISAMLGIGLFVPGIYQGFFEIIR